MSQNRPVPPPPPDQGHPHGAQPSNAAPGAPPPGTQPPATEQHSTPDFASPGSGYAPGTYYAPGWSPAQLAAMSPQPPKPRGRGRLWAVVITTVAVLGLGALLLALNPAVLLKATGATKSLPADVDEARSANVRQLSTGNCLSAVPEPGSAATTLDVVPCGDPHIGQVVSSYSFAQEEWPGLGAARRQVTRSCSLSPQEESDGLTLRALTPSEASWRQGDRVGQCIVIAPEPVAGSFT